MAFQDFYLLLGVATTASTQEINRAFRRLSLAHHPDKLPPDKKAQGEATFKQLGAARETLTNPATRSDYHQKWKRHQEHLKAEQQREKFRRERKEKLKAEEAQKRAREQAITEAREDFARAEALWRKAADAYVNAEARWNEAMVRLRQAESRWYSANYVLDTDYDAEMRAYEYEKYVFDLAGQEWTNEGNKFVRAKEVYDAFFNIAATPSNANPFNATPFNGWSKAHLHNVFMFGSGHPSTFNFAFTFRSANPFSFDGFSASNHFDGFQGPNPFNFDANTFYQSAQTNSANHQPSPAHSFGLEVPLATAQGHDKYSQTSSPHGPTSKEWTVPPRKGQRRSDDETSNRLPKKTLPVFDFGDYDEQM